MVKLQKIQKMVKKVQKVLGLSSYKIKVQLQEKKSPKYAEIAFGLPKKKVVITFFIKKGVGKEELEDTVVHELLHLFLYKHLAVATNILKREYKHSSLRKYVKGEEEAIRILVSLLLGKSILKEDK